MKSAILLCILGCLKLHGAEPGFKASRFYSLKTDLFHPFGLGFEFPSGKRSSVETSLRVFSSVIMRDVTYFDFRVHIKHYFPANAQPGRYAISYWVLGGHLKDKHMVNYPKQDNSIESGDLTAAFLTLGIGRRFKILDIWIAGEAIVCNYENRYVYKDTYGQIQTNRTWQYIFMPSVGCSLSLFNYRAPVRSK